MMEKRRLEAESRVAHGKQRKPLGISALCGKLSQSKTVALVLNLFGAIGCILANKKVMSHDFDFPLTLTMLGYALVSLALRLTAPRGRKRSDDDHEWSKRSHFGLVLLTALAPSLANASLLVNSVGFTQLSKVLTTPLIALMEQRRGAGTPLDARRLASLALVHVGVLLASVADVSVSRKGVVIAMVNVIVTAEYKVRWSAACDQHARLLKVVDVGIQRRLRSERDSPDLQVAELRKLAEATLPAATMVLVPLVAFFEGRRVLAVVRIMDRRAYEGLALAAVLGAFTSGTGYIVIGRLSALTHQFKMAALVLGSHALLGARLNGAQLLGATMTMVAITFYTQATIWQRNRLAMPTTMRPPVQYDDSSTNLLTPSKSTSNLARVSSVMHSTSGSLCARGAAAQARKTSSSRNVLDEEAGLSPKSPKSPALSKNRGLFAWRGGHARPSKPSSSKPVPFVA